MRQLRALLEEVTAAAAAATTESNASAASRRARVEEVGAALQPLFEQLENGTLPAELLDPLADIASHAERRDAMAAENAYMQLAIGKQHWPVGLTNVGIHMRPAAERLRQDRVHHVMNDERTRRWVHAVKQLLDGVRRQTRG